MVACEFKILRLSHKKFFIHQIWEMGLAYSKTYKSLLTEGFLVLLLSNMLFTILYLTTTCQQKNGMYLRQKSIPSIETPFYNIWVSTLIRSLLNRTKLCLLNHLTKRLWNFYILSLFYVSLWSNDLYVVICRNNMYEWLYMVIT